MLQVYRKGWVIILPVGYHLAAAAKWSGGWVIVVFDQLGGWGLNQIAATSPGPGPGKISKMAGILTGIEMKYKQKYDIIFLHLLAKKKNRSLVIYTNVV